MKQFGNFRISQLESAIRQRTYFAIGRKIIQMACEHQAIAIYKEHHRHSHTLFCCEFETKSCTLTFLRVIGSAGYLARSRLFALNTAHTINFCIKAFLFASHLETELSLVFC